MSSIKWNCPNEGGGKEMLADVQNQELKTDSKNAHT